MHEVHGAAGRPAEQEAPTDRLGLGHGRARQAMEFQRSLALIDQLLRHAFDDGVVFRVHLDQESGLARALHQPVPGPVVRVEDRAAVSRVDLRARDAGLHQRRQVALPACGKVRDVEVDRIVDIRPTLDQIESRLERLRKTLARRLRSEIEKRRDASRGRRE